MSIDVRAAPTSHAVAVRRRRLVFVGMAVGIAPVVLPGFPPGFYLRDYFGRPPPPSTTVYAHGVLFTSWLAVLLLQTSLVAVGSVRLHRRIGVGGAVLAGVMVISGWLAQVDHTQRAVASGSYI